MSDESTYDKIPYTRIPFPQTHPDRLASVATLFGLSPVDPQKCRVLELGCGRGGNLIPMAEQLPNSTFLGIELSKLQVEEARRWTEQLGLSNIEIRQANLVDIGPEWGQFDYIICHGVYSWIPVDVRQALLRVCSQNLAPDGLAFVSYNTCPGWSIRSILRDLLMFHCQGMNNPDEILAKSRGLLSRLGTTIAGHEHYRQGFTREIDLWAHQSDPYFYHELLEADNNPVYFRTFIQESTTCKLQYVCESNIATMYPLSVEKNGVALLKEISKDKIEYQQYLDYLLGRSFRQSILCHAGRQVSDQIQLDRISGLYLESYLVPVGRNELQSGSTEVRYVNRKNGATLTASVTDRFIQVAFEVLAEWGNAYCQLPALLSEVRQRIYGVDTIAIESASSDQQSLVQAIWRAYLSGGFVFHVMPPRHAVNVSLRPLASRVARNQAIHGNNVTNLVNEPITLKPWERKVIGLLDGTKTFYELLAAIEPLVEKQELTLEDGNKIVVEQLKSTLANLVRHALLCEPD